MEFQLAQFVVDLPTVSHFAGIGAFIIALIDSMRRR